MLARLAARQHGVVGLRQLRHHGFTASGVRSRVARGRLHRVHRGVYAVGHPLLSTEGRWMAAVLACGPGALLSHGSAASLWGLRRSARARIDVISTGQRGAKRAAIDAHSGATLHPAEATVHDGIPCTTVARTLVDLADVLDRRGLERACEQAEMLRLFDADALADVLSRAGGRRGAARLSAIVAELRPGATLTRSELEERFLALCRSAGVTQPLVNVRVEVDGGTLEVDFLWRDERLVVETDGHASHGTSAAFERDRRRDRLLVLAGWRVARFTWREVVHEPDAVATALRALLADESAVVARSKVESSTTDEEA